jgi:cell division transport system permease protein
MALTRHSDAVAPLRSAGPVTIWLGRHARTASSSFSRLVHQPFASLMIILVIAVTLAIPAAMNLAIKNFTAISSGWDDALDFSVFLDTGVSANEAKALAQLILQRADVDDVRLITAAEALAEFKEQSGFGSALDHLPDNPLPHTLVVRPSPANTPQSMTLLREELDSLPETALVQVDTEWVQRFHAILEIVRQAIMIGAGLLGAAIIVIIGNTIRLEIQNRRDEIEVTKLIGASNAFVRRPFLWSGFWFGLFGSAFALGLVQYGLYLLQPTVTRLAGLYQSGVTMLTLDLRDSLAIIGVGVALGLAGSWLEAARHMRSIEPK